MAIQWPGESRILTDTWRSRQAAEPPYTSTILPPFSVDACRQPQRYERDQTAAL